MLPGGVLRALFPVPPNRPANLRLERVSGAVGLKGDPQSADTDGMKLWWRSVPALLLVVGLLPGPHAGAAEGPTCEASYPLKRPAHLYVQSPGDQGAIGVWRRANGQRLVVRVAPGEGYDWMAVPIRPGAELRLVRCETI